MAGAAALGKHSSCSVFAAAEHPLLLITLCC